MLQRALTNLFGFLKCVWLCVNGHWVFLYACFHGGECVSACTAARLLDGLSAQVNLTLSGHTSGVCGPVRQALSHQQH